LAGRCFRGVQQEEKGTKNPYVGIKKPEYKEQNPGFEKIVKEIWVLEGGINPGGKTEGTRRRARKGWVRFWGVAIGTFSGEKNVCGC